MMTIYSSSRAAERQQQPLPLDAVLCCAVQWAVSVAGRSVTAWQQEQQQQQQQQQ
jgi:hypothetical protein